MKNDKYRTYIYWGVTALAVLLLLVAAVFNHMHKRGNGALRGTVGWQPGFTKQTPCLLGGELAAPVGQQGNVFAAGMVSDCLNQRSRTFAAWRWANG